MLVSSTGVRKQAFAVANVTVGFPTKVIGLVGFEPTAVAAATALPYPIELISTSSGLVISLALRRFGASGEASAVD